MRPSRPILWSLALAALLAAGATPAALAGTPAAASPPGAPAAGPPADYYAAAQGKTGAALKAALHGIVKNQTTVTYDGVWNALKNTDQDPNNANNVILLYSGRSQAKSTNGGGANDWNREHVWAKSHGDFGTATGPGTDLHHLRPEDVSVNSTRGNKDFDLGGSPVSEAPGSRTDADSFEPRDAVKGDVARMLLYMAVRYEGGDGWPNLEPNDKVNNGSAPAMGRLSVLRQWNRQDPPDAFEQRRNDVIFQTYQHNRNPFVDHPEWVDSIWP
ncbi:endonuclease I family protein [Streptomyces sp. BI20]|uniref:endonuclease I family protein n=1 Tax=Streptomyces sp. BI20 TaxID=3403460 RepID=UPI003C77F03A